LAERIIAIQHHWQQVAEPFDWNFTRRDLDQLMARLAARDGVFGWSPEASRSARPDPEGDRGYAADRWSQRPVGHTCPAAMGSRRRPALPASDCRVTG
jgi:hypothetical protein